MKIGYFTSIEGWGGSEMYLLWLMLGVRERGHEVVLFGVEGTRLWEEARAVGIERVAWRSIPTTDCRPQTADLQMGSAGLNHEDTKSQSVRDSGSGIQDSSWSRDDTETESLKSKVYGLKSHTKRIALASVPGWLKLLTGNVREVLHLRLVFKAYPVDVMHVSNSGYEMAGLACRRLGIPTVVMNMITPPEGDTFIRRMLMIYTMQRYDHVSSQSEYCTEKWRCLAGIPKARTSFVWNGTDLNRFKPFHWEKQAGEPFRIVSLGRLHPMKGYKYLIQAMSMLEKCALTIYGEGDEREELERLIRVLGIGERVRLPGHTEVPIEALQHADCFVLPSVSHESCPAVLAQAMACGLPLITSDFGPLAEINQNGKTGIVVPMRDVNGLRGAILRMQCDRSFRHTAGKNGLIFSHDHLSAESMVLKTVGLYAALVRSQVF